MPNQHLPPVPFIPPPPGRSRRTTSRVATLCFWTVMLLWILSICYLGVLAFTHNTGEAEPNGVGSHLVFGSILVFFALAIVIAVSTTGYNRRH